jgi:hypothetical protein
MDVEDWLYITGITLIAVGAGLFHPGAGLTCAGMGLAFPFVLSMVRRPPGPPKGAEKK